MNLTKQVWIGVAIAGVIAVVVGVLAYQNLSAPRKRTIVIAPERLKIDQAAARREVDRRIVEYRAKGEPITVEDFAPQPVDPKDDAAAAYLAAAKWLDTPEASNDPVWDIDLVPDKLTAAQWQQIDAAMETFAPALALIDQADGRNSADWKIEYKSPALKVLLRSLNSARQSANLLRMAALTSHRAGRHEQAVHRLTQMVALARHVDQGNPFLVGHLVASGIARLTTDTIADVVPTLKIAREGAMPPDGHATRQQVTALVAALLDPRTLQHGFARAALAERMAVYDSYKCLIDGRLTMQELFGDPRNKQATTIPTPPTAELLADLAPMLDYHTALYAASKADRLPEFRKQHPPTPAAHSHLSRNLLPAYDRVAFTHYSAVTTLRLAAAALAVRAWSINNNGGLPPSLDALAPAELAAVPGDPMVAAPATIQYRHGMVFSAGVDEGNRRTARRADAATNRSATAATPPLNPDYMIRVRKQ